MPALINTDRIASALAGAMRDVPFAADAVDEFVRAMRELERIVNTTVGPPLAIYDSATGRHFTCDTQPLAVQDTRYCTLLLADLDDSTTTVPVQSAALFPATNGYLIQLGTEVMQVTAGAGTTTWTVARAQAGTGAVLHTQWERIRQLTPAVTTTLAADITSTAETLTVSDTGTGRFPCEDRFYATIDNELVYVTKTAGTTWTIERGVDSVSVAHTAGATITQVLWDEASRRRGVNGVNVERIIFEDAAFVNPGGTDARIAIHREVKQPVRVDDEPDEEHFYPATLMRWDGVAKELKDDVSIWVWHLNWDLEDEPLPTMRFYLGRLIDYRQGKRVYAVDHCCAEPLEIPVKPGLPGSGSGSGTRPGRIVTLTGCQTYVYKASGWKQFTMQGDPASLPPHALLSTQHTDAVPFTPPAKGDMIAGNEDGLWQALGVGADGEVLTADSTATRGVSWQAGGGGGGGDEAARQAMMLMGG